MLTELHDTPKLKTKTHPTKSSTSATGTKSSRRPNRSSNRRSAEHVHDDSDSTFSEEEVVYELDEAALAKIPLRLQVTMRELQLERVRRLQREPGRHIVLRRAGRGADVRETQDTQKWYRSMAAKVAEDKETVTEVDIAENVAEDIDRPQSIGYPSTMRWSLSQRAWVPVSTSYLPEENITTTTTMTMDVDNRAELLGEILSDQVHESMSTHVSITNTAAGSGARFRRTAHYSWEETYERYYSRKSTEPQYAGEARFSQDNRQQRDENLSGSRKRGPALVSVMRDRVRTKFERVKTTFRK
ncbi:hypothetical protein BJX99DRAFT_252611 [Aspergillus californicus]